MPIEIINSLENIIDGWEIQVEGILPKLILAIVVFVIFYILGRIFKQIGLRLNTKLLKQHPDFVKIITACLYFFFLLSGTFLSLRLVGLERLFTQALAGAGIIGIIAGFALKDIASNAFSGLLLFFERPYKKGDWVQIDGHYGIVDHIGWLTTTLKNITGQDVYISNQLTYSGAFINYSNQNTRRVIFQGDIIAQNTAALTTRDLLSATIQKCGSFRSDSKIDFYVKGLGADGSFSTEIRFWLDFQSEEQFLQSISDILIDIRQALFDQKITISNIQWVSDEEDVTSAGNYGPGG